MFFGAFKNFVILLFRIFAFRVRLRLLFLARLSLGRLGFSFGVSLDGRWFCLACLGRLVFAGNLPHEVVERDFVIVLLFVPLPLLLLCRINGFFFRSCLLGCDFGFCWLPPSLLLFLRASTCGLAGLDID